jgi:hypothetical protein
MSEESEQSERLYEGTLRQVLWGEGRDEVMHRLQVNGIAGSEADRLFDRAMRERISMIRGGYWRRITRGGLVLAIGVGLFSGIGLLTEGYSVFNLLTIAVPACVTAFGAWRFFGGVIGVLTAASRTGSISEIDC